MCYVGGNFIVMYADCPPLDVLDSVDPLMNYQAPRPRPTNHTPPPSRHSEDIRVPLVFAMSRMRPRYHRNDPAINLFCDSLEEVRINEISGTRNYPRECLYTGRFVYVTNSFRNGQSVLPSTWVVPPIERVLKRRLLLIGLLSSGCMEDYIIQTVNRT